jgi:large subunit ribosomal protein L1
MLTYAASSVHPQEITPSLISFKPKPLSTTFSLYPLVLNHRERRLSKWVNVNFQREAKHGASHHTHVVVSALAAEAEVADAVEEKEEVEGVSGPGTGTGTVTVPKPKKGKAALPLKRDRVCEKKVVSFW